jgi:hypothetical protein
MLWLRFVINARNFDATQEVGMKGEDATYYGVPLPYYINLCKTVIAFSNYYLGGVGCG